jgi:hypothetical protein
MEYKTGDVIYHTERGGEFRLDEKLGWRVWLAYSMDTSDDREYKLDERYFKIDRMQPVIEWIREQERAWKERTFES